VALRSVADRPLTFSDVDFADIQGLVRFGHAHLKAARFFLLRIVDPAAARAWLAARTPPRSPIDDAAFDVLPVTPPVRRVAPDPLAVTTAVKGDLPDTALQVAFTCEGLKVLGIPQRILDGFALEFTAGMTEKSRARRLGDVGANAPERWDWGATDRQPHVLLMVYARKGGLDSFEGKLKDEKWDAAFATITSLDTQDNDDDEPFGFADGISQPVIDWDRQKPRRLGTTRTYTNVAALGEFLLGYPNEYCRYTDRPLLDPADDPQALLPLAEEVPGKRDFGRNGTYLVLRDLAQDVVGLWEFVDRQAQHDPAKREELARAMVGRMRSGDPIVPLSDYSIAGIAEDPDDRERVKELWKNQFTFDKDPLATACPYGAHIRRANPRNADLPAGTRGPISKLLRTLGFAAGDPHDDVLASTRFHRILRRGREYGKELKPEDAVNGQEREVERGLRFICLNANISRQFEFVQTAWIASAKFSGTDEGDPLLGHRRPGATGRPTNVFTRPQDNGLCERTTGLPQFVTVHGGAYFFMPGISALRYLASGAGAH